MNRSSFLIAIIGILAGFTIGFIFANSINRAEIERLKSEVLNKVDNSASPASTDTLDLTDEQISGAIAKADAEPKNLELQKNLGLNLYRYANLKQNAKLLPEAERLLRRAISDNSTDYELIVSMANLLFDLSQSKKSSENLKESQSFYERALKIKPDDSDVRADYGLTFFLAEPAAIKEAIEQYQKVLQQKPDHEKSLQNIVAALIKQKDSAEATKYLTKLREINPKNENLTDLQNQIEAIGKTK